MIAFTLGGTILPMTPEKVTVATAGNLKTWNVIDLGAIVFPRGRDATQVTFAFTLPGLARANAPYVQSWQDPTGIVGLIGGWMENGTAVPFVVSDTGINLSVYVRTFSYSPFGGFGDVACQIGLVEARRVTVPILALNTTASDGSNTSAAGDASGTTDQPINPYRTQPTPKASYTIKPGDTLWSIAKLQLGAGASWNQIYTANAATIGSNPNLIQPGTQIVLPGGQG